MEKLRAAYYLTMMGCGVAAVGAIIYWVSKTT